MIWPPSIWFNFLICSRPQGNSYSYSLQKDEVCFFNFLVCVRLSAGPEIPSKYFNDYALLCYKSFLILVLWNHFSCSRKETRERPASSHLPQVAENGKNVICNYARSECSRQLICTALLLNFCIADFRRRCDLLPKSFFSNAVSSYQPTAAFFLAYCKRRRQKVKEMSYIIFSTVIAGYIPVLVFCMSFWTEWSEQTLQNVSAWKKKGKILWSKGCL